MIQAPRTTPTNHGAWHRILDHTSELTLELGAPSWGALLAEAGRALGELLLAGSPATPDPAWRVLELAARDREALLVDWLNELLFLAETERWIVAQIEIESAAADRLRARVRGVRVAAAPAAVKAATFHGLALRESAEGLRGEVTLDV